MRGSATNDVEPPAVSASLRHRGRRLGRWAYVCIAGSSEVSLGHSRAAVWLATATLLVAYVGTSGVGAALFPSKFGQHQLAAFLWPETVNFDAAILGSPTYWTHLLSLAVIAPITALMVGSAVGRFTPNLTIPKIPMSIPIALATLMIAIVSTNSPPLAHCLHKQRWIPLSAMRERFTAHGADRTARQLLLRIGLFITSDPQLLFSSPWHQRK